MSDINIIIKMQADNAIKGADKLKNGLKGAQDASNKLTLSIENTTSAFKVFAGNIAALGVQAAIRGVVSLTRSIADLGIESVQAASDAEETLNKFKVVYKDVAKEADATAESLALGFGLARTEAKTLLADTGDLLTGFGFTGESALNLSKQVQELAVDLASFTNFSGGAQGASQALTKALLGERESVKALGIAILEEDVKKQVAINTAKGLVFETERQAKAQATLDIALRQSKNAIGDFARSQDSFANQSRILDARIRDLKETIGSELLPVANAATKAISNFLASLDEKMVAKFVRDGIIYMKDSLIDFAEIINPVATTLKILGNTIRATFNVITSTVRFAASVFISSIGAMTRVIGGLISILPFTDGIAKKFEQIGNAYVRLGSQLSSNSVKDAGEFLDSLKGIGEAFGDTIDTEGFQESITEAMSNVNPIVQEHLDLVASEEDILLNLEEAWAENAKKREMSYNDAVAINRKRVFDEVKTNKQILKSEEELVDDIEKAWKAQQQLKEDLNKKEIAARDMTLNALSGLMRESNNELFEVGKAAAIATATIDGIAATQRVFKDLPYPISIAAAAAMAITTAANVSRIASTPRPKFAEGGVVPGNSFTGDRVDAQVNSGEVILNQRQQANTLFALANGGTGGGRPITVYTTVEVEGEAIARAVSNQVADGYQLGERL